MVDENANENGKKLKRADWGKWGVIAACLVLITCVAILFIQRKANQDAYKGSLPPGVIIDSGTFIESGWNTAIAECPDGFSYGGMIEAATYSGEYLSGCKYYLNPAIPEWAYVYGPVWNEHGDAYMAYNRFVLPDIRHNTFIQYGGPMYSFSITRTMESRRLSTATNPDWKTVTGIESKPKRPKAVRWRAVPIWMNWTASPRPSWG